MTTTTITTEETVPARYRVGQHVRLVHEQKAWNDRHEPGLIPAGELVDIVEVKWISMLKRWYYRINFLNLNEWVLGDEIVEAMP